MVTPSGSCSSSCVVRACSSASCRIWRPSDTARSVVAARSASRSAAASLVLHGPGPSFRRRRISSRPRRLLLHGRTRSTDAEECWPMPPTTTTNDVASQAAATPDTAAAAANADAAEPPKRLARVLTNLHHGGHAIGGETPPATPERFARRDRDRGGRAGRRRRAAGRGDLHALRLPVRRAQDELPGRAPARRAGEHRGGRAEGPRLGDGGRAAGRPAQLARSRPSTPTSASSSTTTSRRTPTARRSSTSPASR